MIYLIWFYLPHHILIDLFDWLSTWLQSQMVIWLIICQSHISIDFIDYQSVPNPYWSIWWITYESLISIDLSNWLSTSLISQLIYLIDYLPASYLSWFIWLIFYLFLISIDLFDWLSSSLISQLIYLIDFLLIFNLN